MVVLPWLSKHCICVAGHSVALLVLPWHLLPHARYLPPPESRSQTIAVQSGECFQYWVGKCSRSKAFHNESFHSRSPWNPRHAAMVECLLGHFLCWAFMLFVPGFPCIPVFMYGDSTFGGCHFATITSAMGLGRGMQTGEAREGGRVRTCLFLATFGSRVGGCVGGCVGCLVSV